MKNFPSHTPDIGLRRGRTSSARPGPRLDGAGRVSAARRGAGAVIAVLGVLTLSSCSKNFDNMTEPVAAFVQEAQAGTKPVRVRYCFADSAEDQLIADRLAQLRDAIARYGKEPRTEIVSAAAARGYVRVDFPDAPADAPAWLFTVEYSDRGWRICDIREGDAL